MIQNAEFVDSCLVNKSFSKRAQHGIDCTVKTVKYFTGQGKILLDKTEIPNYTELFPVNGFYNLDKGVYSITFNEGCSIPQGYCGWFKSRSSSVRNGCIVESGLYDNGFTVDYMGAFLFVNYPVIIEQNARIAQFIMAKAQDSELYDGQWQKDKDKK